MRSQCAQSQAPGLLRHPTSDQARSSAGWERLASPRTVMHLGPRAHLAPNTGQVS